MLFNDGKLHANELIAGKANLIATLNQGLAFRTGKKEKPGLISFFFTATSNSISVLMFRNGTKTIDLFDKVQSGHHSNHVKWLWAFDKK